MIYILLQSFVSIFYLLHLQKDFKNHLCVVTAIWFSEIYRIRRQIAPISALYHGKLMRASLELRLQKLCCTASLNIKRRAPVFLCKSIRKELLLFMHYQKVKRFTASWVFLCVGMLYFTLKYFVLHFGMQSQIMPSSHALCGLINRRKILYTCSKELCNIWSSYKGTVVLL